jgi:class 3 adenylate cyclase
MRAKNLLLIALSLALTISILSAVSAEIILSQPKAVYSLGDDLNTDVKLDYIKTGYLDVDLICDGNQTNIYHNVPEGKTITIKRTLTPEYIQDLHGSCYLSAEYDNAIKTGQTFEISDQIEIEMQSATLEVKAGESITLKGVAYKKNGQLVGQIYPAFAEAEVIDGLGTVNVTKTDVVNDGQFNLQVYIPETTRAGKKSIVLKIYDKDSQDNVLNSGETALALEVRQEPSEINIAIDKLLIVPGENVTIIPSLYDKAGDSMDGDLSIKILDSRNKSIYSASVSSNEKFVFQTNTTNLPGLNTVVAEMEGIENEKAFQLEELKRVSADISGNILTISNIGNVPYNDNVDVKIGNKTFTEYVELDYGGKKEYKISAPDGDYEITLKENSGNSEILSRSGVALTGNTVSMTAVGTKLGNLFTQYPIVWIFIVLVLALFVWVYYKKYQKEGRAPVIAARLMGNRERVQNLKRTGGVEVIRPEKRDEKIDELTLHGEIRRAEQVLVLQGQKQPVSVIAIKVKNSISGIAKDNFDKALEYAYKAKAVSYVAGDVVLLIFSPLLTKTFKNEETAIKAAQDIDNALKEHNRKFRNDPISYGIGLNCGDIINRREMRTLQFTNIGKTMNIAKRIAEISNQEVLLSQEIHEKTMNSVKTEKVATGSMDVFVITRVVDSEQSKKFISEFLRRQN